MIIKENFELLNKIPNLMSIPDATLQSYESEENSPRHIFTFLTLKQKNIKHFTKDKMMEFIGNTKDRAALRVVSFEKYPLAVTFNKTTKNIVLNLKPFDVDDIASLNPNDLFALITYGYGFSKLITGNVKIGDIYAKPIIDFLTSMFVRVFGKDYGLTEIYSTGIPKLKFLLSCYIFSSFFGYTGIKMINRASSTAPYDYKDEESLILKYDFTSIIEFLKALSDMRVMRGIKPYGFTTKIYRFFGIDMITAMEDLSRFISTITVASIGGSRVIPTFISKYNDRAFGQIIEISKKVYR